MPPTESHNPSISAIIIVYNGEAFVTDAIESILAQSRLPDEILVIDDGSTDGTPAILDRYAERIRVVRQPNGGEANARNRGLAEARQELVAFLDADDLWEPAYVERVVERFAERPELGMVFTGYRETALQTGQSWTYTQPLPEDWLRRFHFSSLWVTTPSKTTLRRDLAQQLGGFDEQLPSCVDQDLYLRAGLAAPFDYIPEALAVMRRSGSNLSANVPRMWQASKQFYRKHRRTFGGGIAGWLRWRRAKGTCRRVYARKLLSQGYRLPALGAEMEAAAIWPGQSFRRFVRFWEAMLLGKRPAPQRAPQAGGGKEVRT